MTSQIVECPQCQAPLNLTPERQFCQCTYCGSRFVVTQPDGKTPRLARFESVLSTPAAKTMLRDAEQRLADLELTMADVEDELETKQAELAEQRSAHYQARVNLQRRIAPLQNATYVVGLLAALAVFAALFLFRRPQRLPGAIIGVLLVVTGWAFHREWQETEESGQGEVQEAREAVQEAEAELNDILFRLEDQRLECELLQTQILPATPAPPAESPAEPSAT